MGFASIKKIYSNIKEINQLNRLGLSLGWVSAFMDCMFDTNNKKEKVSLTSF